MRRTAPLPSTVALCLAQLALLQPRRCSAGQSRLHIIFSTECSPYFDWQSVGMFWSVLHTYRESGLDPPRTTRLTACDDPSKVLRRIHEEGSWEGYHPNFDTHVHPTYNRGRCPPTAPRGECNPSDDYSAYNKPGSVAHWLEHGERVDEATDYVIFLDADQIVRRVIDPDALGARPGRPVSALYSYLQGTKDEVHMGVKARMVREGKRKTPFEQVGGFFIHHIDDLRRVAPLWLQYTQRVRADPDSWANTGDVYNCPEAPRGCEGKACGCRSPPWISEMYGYVFAASEVGLRHTINNNLMLYPAYAADHLSEPYPLVIHYGLLYTIDLGPGKGYWAFDKHWYRETHRIGAPLACPSGAGEATLLNDPPPEDVVRAARSKSSWKTQGIALFMAWALANATFAYVQGTCPSSPPRRAVLRPFASQTPYACAKGGPSGLLQCHQTERADPGGGGGYDGDAAGPTIAPTPLPPGACGDHDTRGWCCDWYHKGECEKNKGYMQAACTMACGFCDPPPGVSVCGRRARPLDRATPKPPDALAAPATRPAGRAAAPLPPGAGGAANIAVAYSGWAVAVVLLAVMRYRRPRQQPRAPEAASPGAPGGVIPVRRK